MALSITVNGAGTFTASMEEGPVSFTASLGAVPGPKGDTGATGPAGVVAATAPITYNSGTQTVGISATPTFTTVNTTSLNLTTATFADATAQTTAFVGEARKVYVTARNNSGSTIAAGKVVYLTGATGNKPTIGLAQANAEGTSARVIGITVESIANNADGKVITSGVAENIDTSAFTAGDVVYLSATTAGGMTTTLPTQPYHGVALGIVTRSNANLGSVEVQVNNYQELDELSDVLITSAANLDLLSWDSASSTWQNKTFATLGLLTSATAASTYQTQAGMSSYALLASPTFTGDPKAPTPATSDNDTSIATTAFVNAYCPAASTSTAGKVQLATDAEANAGTNSTKAITPRTASELVNSSMNYDIGQFAWLTAVSGTGHTVSQTRTVKELSSNIVTAIGYSVAYIETFLANRGAAFAAGTAGIDWSKTVRVFARIGRNANAPSTNSITRLTLGKINNSGVAGDPAVRAIGIKIDGDTMSILAHNGTSLTTASTTYTRTSTPFDLMLESDGAGNVTAFVNDSQVGTTTGGPTNAGAARLNALHYEVENTAVVTTGTQAFIVNPRVFVGA